MARKRPPLQGFDDLPVSRIVHLRDDTPGYTRKGAGRGFYYVDAEGRKVEDEDHLRRFEVLAVPPAYRDVWLAPLANAHLQATGRDDRGRKQYRYHPVWQAHRNTTKFEHLVEFGSRLPALRRKVARLLGDHDPDTPPSRDLVIAAAVRVIDLTGLRVGNVHYTRENETYGVTTLQQKHAAIHGSRIEFDFVAKGGKASSVDFTSRKLAEVLSHCEELDGQTLFQYRSADGEPAQIASQDINDFLKDTIGADWATAKTLRTWRGSVHALEALADETPAEGERERASQVVAAVKKVAEALRNRPATCRKFYIHPAILEAFENERWPPPEAPEDKPRELLLSEARLMAFLGAAG
ncbi:hypothetical protein [Halomonas denitrificans]|nr:hypothetical protein [Halomonas denitrificans]